MTKLNLEAHANIGTMEFSLAAILIELSVGSNPQPDHFERVTMFTPGKMSLLFLVCCFSGVTSANLNAQDDRSVAGQEDEQEENIVQVTPSMIISESLTYATMGNHEKALELVEKLYADLPDELGVKLHLLKRINHAAIHYARVGKTERAHELYFRAGKMLRICLPELAEEQVPLFKKANFPMLYNEACAYAINGDKENCLASLQLAIDWGFNDVAHLMDDPDLQHITNGPEVAEILGDVLVKYREFVRSQARELISQHEAAPFDLELPNLNSKNIKLSDYTGKVVYVTFWSTGNAESRKNLEAMARLKESLKGRDVKFIAISCEKSREQEEVFEKVAGYLEENPVQFTCLIGNRNVRKFVRNNYKMPSTFLLDRDGKLQAVIPGKLAFVAANELAEILLENEDP